MKSDSVFSNSRDSPSWHLFSGNITIFKSSKSITFFPPRNCVELEAGGLDSNSNPATYKFCDFFFLLGTLISVFLLAVCAQ